jgi:hypothetical protein
MKYSTAQFANQRLTLPEDINSFVEKDINARFQSAGLTDQMKKWRERRRFGDLSFMAKDGKLACIINYQSGIIVRYYLIKRDQTEDGLIEGKWSIMNENIDPKTQKREKDGKNG